MYVDLLLLILMILWVIRGALSGVVTQIFSLLSWIFVILLAPSLAQWFQHQNSWLWLAAAPLATLWILSALLLFGFMMLIEWIVQIARKNPRPSPAGRWMGAGVGLIKALVMVVILGAVLHLIPDSIRLRFPDLDKDLSQSRFLSMGRAALTWDSLRFFGSLRAVQTRVNESTSKMMSPEQPWIPERDTDTE